MLRMTTALAAAAATVAITAAGAHAAAPRTAARVPADQPPYAYKDCVSAAKQKGESPSYAKWHCDELVKKGWVKKPHS
ncbi:hypothetical protein ACFP1Z_30540 [Streptomyces gamaensis]|uniref:Uncharacterized protein n=1 Tax=Streptomyces gamaensis TaxID=1763542 RepID=A0ABW0Z8Q1_9ACTN